MDMSINGLQIKNVGNINIKGQKNDFKTNNVPDGYKEVSKEEFFKILSSGGNTENFTKALDLVVAKMEEKNDKKYPTITTGRVQSIKDDGKITVQMLGDESDATETVGYTNQTPFIVNQNDFVKVCKQTAGDKVNSWILGVNSINNKKDALVLLEKCFDCILMLQEEINDLKTSIQSLSDAYESTTDTITVDGTKISVPTIKIHGARINQTLQLLRNLKTVDNDVRIMKDELHKINQGKNISN